MLPGFRFLFVATLLTLSLLIFGVGAAALLRASHERFAGLPTRPAPEQTFTRVADVVPPADSPPPTLSMLRVEPAADVARAEVRPAAEPLDTLLPADRIASLSATPRVDAVTVPSSVIAEPTIEAITEATPMPVPEDAAVSIALAAEQPVAAAPVVPATAADPVVIAKVEEPPRAEPPVVTTPEPALTQIAALPEPETTGTTSAVVVEPPLKNARPIRRPPLPRDRPAVDNVLAALPDAAVAAPTEETVKPALRKRRPVVKRVVKPKRRVVSRPAPQRPAATNPAAPFGGSPFGT